jgi:predicted DNA-binding transcriptional regulator YafY
MDTAKFVNLPDSLTTDETHALFKELLALQPTETPKDAVALAQAMDEVADRHWHTYTLLDDAIRNAVDDWVMNNWDRNSFEKVRALISVIAKLGLVNSAEMLRREVHLPMRSAVRNEIESALTEFGTTVEDPYSGMRKPHQ